MLIFIDKIFFRTLSARARARARARPALQSWWASGPYPIKNLKSRRCGAAVCDFLMWTAARIIINEKVAFQKGNAYCMEMIKNSTLWEALAETLGSNSGENFTTGEILGI